MSILRVSSVICVALLTLVVPAHAGPPLPPDGRDAGPAPDVDALVRLALDRAPSVAVLRSKLAASREQQEPAGALPDPMVGIMLQTMGPPWNPQPPMSMGQVEVSQGLPYPGKQRARREAAEAEVAIRAADVDALRARLSMRVRSTYAQLYALDQERASLSAGNELVDALVAAASARYAAAQGGQEALAKVDLERSALGEREADLSADRAALVATLDWLTGQDPRTPMGTVDRLPEPRLPSGALLDTALADAPELRVERAGVEASHRRLHAAETETRPDFLVGLAAGSTTTGDPVVTLRVGVELPLWRGKKQDPLIRAAQHDVEAARDQLADAELTVRAELERLEAQWRRDGEQIARYREAIVPQSSVALGAARGSYATGQGDFTTVIDDFRRWLEARVGLARREADRFTTWAEIEALVAAPAPGPARGDVP